MKTYLMLQQLHNQTNQFKNSYLHRCFRKMHAKYLQTLFIKEHVFFYEAKLLFMLDGTEEVVLSDEVALSAFTNKNKIYIKE